MAEPSPRRETEDNTEPENPSPEETGTAGAPEETGTATAGAPEETGTAGAPEADPATEVESSTPNILAVTVEIGHVPQVAECEDPSSNEQTSRVEGNIVSEIEGCDPSVSTGQPVKAQSARVSEAAECEGSASNEQSRGILRPSVSDVEIHDASASPVSDNQVLNVDQNAVCEAQTRATPVSSSQAMKPGERWVPTAETGAIPKTRKFTVPETETRGEWASSSTGDRINASEGRYQMSKPSSSFPQENPSDLQMWSTDPNVPQAAASYELQEMSPLLGGDSESQLAASNIDVPVNLPGGLEARAGPSHENGRAAPKRLYSGKARRRSPPANIASCGAARKVLLRMSPNRRNRLLRKSPNGRNRGDFQTSVERDSLVAKLGSSEVTPNRYEQSMGQLGVQQPPWRKCLNFIFSTSGLVAAVAAVFLVGGVYNIYIFMSQSDEGSGVAGAILLAIGIMVAALAAMLAAKSFEI